MSWGIGAGAAAGSQWNPGAVLADPAAAAAAGYTPDQWAILQQQNWQQWVQWQQQYAQWQPQYSDKYVPPAQPQVMAISSMGAMPPLPAGSAPAPPQPPQPPQPPPPPAPHENNQPLYRHTAAAAAVSAAAPAPAPAPAPAAAPRQAHGQAHGQGYGVPAAAAWPPAPAAVAAAAPAQAVNADALKKLAEEERLFDIQFQKWEEEIDKWKRENVNHPDKQAYKEYENKFEACRAQLLERRRQMDARKARLLGAAPPPQGPPAPAKPAAPAAPAPVVAHHNHNHNHNHTQSAPAQAFQHNQPPTPNQPRTFPRGDQPQNFGKPPHSDTQASQAQYKNAAQGPANVGNARDGMGVDPYAGYQQYGSVAEHPRGPEGGSGSFLPASAAKGIPGLDLVPEARPPEPPVVDITGEDSGQGPPRAPDYSTISQGINNILGDEKIMNILHMVRGQPATPTDEHDTHHVPRNQQTMQPRYNNTQQYNQNAQPYNQNMPPYNQNMPPYNQNMAPPNQSVQQRNSNMPPSSHNQNMQLYNMNVPPPNQSVQAPNQNMAHNQNQLSRNYNHQQVEQRPSNQSMQFHRPPPGHGQPPAADQGPGGHYGQREAPPPLMAVPVRPPGAPAAQGPQGSQGAQDPPPRKWVEEPLFSPAIIVEYEHKPLRLKARDFIEPVHMFDYNHISKEEEFKPRDFEREADELFVRKPRGRSPERPERPALERPRDYERRRPAPLAREERAPSPYEYRAPRTRALRSPTEPEERRRAEPYAPYHRRERERDRPDHARAPPPAPAPPRDHYTRREDYSRREDTARDARERHRFHDHRSGSREMSLDSRKRARSRDSEAAPGDSKRASTGAGAGASAAGAAGNANAKAKAKADPPQHVVMIDDLLEPPGRAMRPEKIVIILRGPPGSGKSYLAKLIRDREAEHGGAARIMSIDDYFMQEGEQDEVDPATGKTVKRPTLKYEYDPSLEEAYLSSLKRAFKRSITDGYYSFLIYDAVNDQLKSYADVWNFARQNNFQVYVCTLELDAGVCHARNVHGRSLEDVQVVVARWFPTPHHHLALDAGALLQSASIDTVDMEDAHHHQDQDAAAPANAPTGPADQVENCFTSKWERMDDAQQLARLDGTSRPLRAQPSMEEYLQLDEWRPHVQPGKKTVRWADIEERREQQRARAMGFVLGATDWARLTDPSRPDRALQRTKYIEPRAHHNRR